MAENIRDELRTIRDYSRGALDEMILPYDPRAPLDLKDDEAELAKIINALAKTSLGLLDRIEKLERGRSRR